MGGIMMPYMGDMGQQGYVAPNQIPNLSLWYNASASSTVVNGVSTNNFNAAVVNGSSISKWVDLQKLGGDSNVNGGSGKNPTYTIPIQNGLGSVTYNSANGNNLDINPVSTFIPGTGLTGMTVYVLARPTTLAAGVWPLTVSDTELGIWWNGTNWSVGQSIGNYGTSTVTNDTTKFHIYGMVFDGSQTGNANRMQFRYDKAGRTLTFTGTIGANTGTGASAPAYFFFGGDNRAKSVNATFTGTYMDGYIGEVLIWTRTLSSSEVSSVELYLNQKWNLGLT